MRTGILLLVLALAGCSSGVTRQSLEASPALQSGKSDKNYQVVWKCFNEYQEWYALVDKTIYNDQGYAESVFAQIKPWVTEYYYRVVFKRDGQGTTIETQKAPEEFTWLPLDKINLALSACR